MGVLAADPLPCTSSSFFVACWANSAGGALTVQPSQIPPPPHAAMHQVATATNAVLRALAKIGKHHFFHMLNIIKTRSPFPNNNNHQGKPCGEERRNSTAGEAITHAYADVHVVMAS
ncbi:MAG: hypothetical protein H7225_16620 [Massilia sp.]|nr:hypothetical protein [Aquabacterium sp.]